jgi:hypothetical protein
VLQKVQLREGPLDGKVAIVSDLRPKVRFRFNDADGVLREATYRKEEEQAAQYVFEAEEPVGGF